MTPKREERYTLVFTTTQDMPDNRWRRLVLERLLLLELEFNKTEEIHAEVAESKVRRGYVLAHYNEDLRWLPGPIENFPYIYHKGDNANVVESRFLSKLPNIGREAHTFIHHIISHWDELDEVTVFLQGAPLDHFSPFDLINQDCQWFSWLAKWMPTDDQTGDPYWPGHNLKDWYNRIVGTGDCPEKITFGAGGQFIATRDAIHAVGLDRWKALMEIAESDPEFPWAMERMWGLLFETARPVSEVSPIPSVG